MSLEFQQAAQRLAETLRHENEALKRLDFQAAMTLVPAKEAALADLTSQPRLTEATLSPALAALGQRLGTLAAENQILLERAIVVQTRIVRIVAQAARPPPGVTRYGGQGRPAQPKRAAAIALSTRA